MLDGFSITQGLNDLQGIANWILGTAFVLMVIAGCLGAVVWGGGKAFGSAKHTSWGIKAVYLTGIAALVLGALGGGIKWSSTNDKTEGVMPVEAQKRNVNIDRPAVSTQCKETVSLQESHHRAGGLEESKPKKEETDWFKGVAKEMGLFDKSASKVIGKSVSWDMNGTPVRPEHWKKWDSYGKERKWQISKITWLPNGEGADCSVENKKVSDDYHVEVVVWQDVDVLGSAPLERGMGTTMDSNYLVFTLEN